MRKLPIKINIILVLISIAISFSSNSAYPENSFCLRVPMGIRYDIAKLTVEAIDILKSGDVSELIKFAEEKSKLGKYEEVASLIGLSGIKDRRLENLLSQTQKKLQALKRCDELKKDGFDSIVVPDGKGGFFVDTLGFKGKWVVRIKAASKIDNGYILRLLKSISIVTAELKNKIDFQNVYIVDGIDDIAIDVIQKQNGKQEAALYVSPSFAEKDRMVQRARLREVFSSEQYGNINKMDSHKKEIEPAVQNEQSRSFGPIQMVSLNETSNIGISLLGQTLERKNIKIAYNFLTDEMDSILAVRDAGMALRDSMSNETILQEYRMRFSQAVLKMQETGSKIICISVTTPMIEKTNLLIDIIKQNIPDAIIIVGGPSTKTSEQLAAIMPRADVLIRGEADEILPEVIEILAGHTAMADLSEKQIERLLSLKGGLFARTGSVFIVNNLYKTNSVDNFHLEEPRDAKKDNTLFTSRGCPYNCSFCNLAFERGFRAVPNEEVIDWLIKRLALELKDKDYKETRSLIEGGENLFGHGLERPLKIEIWDDNFFLDKERIKDLSEKMAKLGIQRYFTFSIEGGSIRALYRNGKIDEELVDALWKGGFRRIRLGTDGLSDAVLAQNNKGYTFDQVIRLNKYLRERGFLVRHNLIYSTPLTSRKEFFESMFLKLVFPKALSGLENAGIIGDPNTDFNKLDVLNFSETYIWDERSFPGNREYSTKENYIVPRQTEYALRRYTPLNIPDSRVRGIVQRSICNNTIGTRGVFSDLYIGDEDIENMLREWEQGRSEELRALAEIVRKIRGETKEGIEKIGLEIRRQMIDFGIYSFVEYRDKICRNHQNIYGLALKDVTTIDRCFSDALGHAHQGLLGKAIEELHKAEKFQPHNPESYYAGAAISLLAGVHSDACEIIIECINNSNISVPVYFKDRSRVLRAFIAQKVLNKLLGKSAEEDPYDRGAFVNKKELEKFNSSVDSIMHNVIEYFNFFSGKSSIVSLLNLPGPQNKNEKIRDLMTFTRTELVSFLGDDKHIRDKAYAAMHRRLMMFGFNRYEDTGGMLRGEDKKDPAKALTVLISDMYHDPDEGNEFDEQGGKRVYTALPFNFTLIRMEPDDVLGSSLSNAAYVIVKGKKDNHAYIGLANTETDNLNYLPHFIMRSELEDIQIILIMNERDRVESRDFLENLEINSLKCECIWVNSDHLAVSADLNGYAIFDRKKRKFYKATAWDKMEDGDENHFPEQFLKLSEMLSSFSGNRNAALTSN